MICVLSAGTSGFKVELTTDPHTASATTSFSYFSDLQEALLYMKSVMETP